MKPTDSVLGIDRYYVPNNHYWRKADGAVFSSALPGFIPECDVNYRRWLADGNCPTRFPCDANGMESDSELAAVLLVNGCINAAAVLNRMLARAAALAKLDPLICQIKRYEELGENADRARGALAARMQEINEKYPVS